MSINATLFGQMITFALFVWFTMRFVWPPIIKALSDRQAKIADGLAAADRGHRDLELAKKKASEAIHTAKQEAHTILDEAKRRASLIEQEAKESARLEQKRLVGKAEEEANRLFEDAKDKLRHEVAKIAVAGAERITKRTVDASMHKAVLDELIQEL